MSVTALLIFESTLLSDLVVTTLSGLPFFSGGVISELLVSLLFVADDFFTFTKFDSSAFVDVGFLWGRGFGFLTSLVS